MIHNISCLGYQEGGSLVVVSKIKGSVEQSHISIPGVSKRSEQSENDSKLKSMKYLVKILF